VNRVKRKLLKAHTHAGRELKPGAPIELRPDQAAWLEQEGVIAPATAVTTASAAKSTKAGEEQ
jgi:hypothetical protein